jgi:MSHA biogenesis protein MshM
MGLTFPNHEQRVEPILVPRVETTGERHQQFLQHFGLRELPFGVTPNPGFLFSSKRHRAALESLVQSIESNLGFTVLLGEPGMGKTTLLRQLLRQYRDSARTAFLFQTQGKRYDLLRYLASELELPDSKGDEVLLHQGLKEMLVNEARAGRKVLIIVDEAQNLRQSSLEAIRLLSDFETSRTKLLHIILAGSARLGETLQAPELSSLAQRIMTICRLEPFTPEEVKAYIAFRLETAGCRFAGSVFSAKAMAAIAEESGGVPRLINSVCYGALFMAFGDGKRHVNVELVRRAAGGLDLWDRSAGLNARGDGHLLRAEEQNGSNSFSNINIAEEPGAGDVASHLKESFPAMAGPEPDEHEESWPAEQNPTNRAEAAQFSSSFSCVSSSQQWNESIPDAARRNAPSVGVPALSAFFRFATAKTDRSTALLAVLVAITLVLWVGLYQLRDKDVRDAAAGGTANPVPAAAIAHSPANEVPRSAAAEAAQPNTEKPHQTSLPSGLLVVPTASGQTNNGSANRKTRESTGSHTTAPIVETLAQTESPSKISRQSGGANDEAEPAVPAKPGTISRLSSQANLPLANVQPRIPLLNMAAMTTSPSTPDVSQRRPVKVVQPEYPEVAKIRHIGGVVLLELEVDARGDVQKVRPVSGNTVLSEAAQAAARQWHYPPSSDDQAAPYIVQVRFNFSLNSEKNR